MVAEVCTFYLHNVVAFLRFAFDAAGHRRTIGFLAFGLALADDAFFATLDGRGPAVILSIVRSFRICFAISKNFVSASLAFEAKQIRLTRRARARIRERKGRHKKKLNV